MRRVTIALLGKTLIDWGGGLDILRLFAQSLALQREAHDFQLYLLLPGDDPLTRMADMVRPYKDVFRQLARLERPSRSKASGFNITAVTEIFDKMDGLTVVFFRNAGNGLAQCLREIQADVVLPSIGSLGRHFPCPWVGYIPDLQHRHFPQFFTPSECAKRDEVYGKLLEEAGAVIVNSRAAQSDVGTFFPRCAARIQPLPFAPVPDERWFEPDLQNVGEKYQLPPTYFVISNQLWVHKAHGTAFEALALLDGSNDAHIICTGQTADSRFPGYFEELQEKIRQLGLGERVRFLGHIPKIDQINVMRRARAVIQPTLFEGGPGGGAVYDAVAMGVPAIVSDIPVNKEICEEGITFFRSGSAEDLAGQMAVLLASAPEKRDPAELIARGQMRARNLGNALLQAIETVINREGKVR